MRFQYMILVMKFNVDFDNPFIIPKKTYIITFNMNNVGIRSKGFGFVVM